MALPAGFWTTDGDTARWLHSWSGYNQNMARTGSVSPGYTGIIVQLGGSVCFQLPYSRGADSRGTIESQPADGLDTGYFYAVPTAGGPTLWPMAIECTGNPGRVGSSTDAAFPEPSGVGDTYCLGGELEPSNPNTAFYAWYATGFTDTAYGTRPSGYDLGILLQFGNGVHTVRHYQPWAWHGRPPEVIAAIAMKAGLSTDYIDSDAFDDAYDEYDLATGSAPWTSWPTAGGRSDGYKIWCSRKVGKKVVDLIFECARHTRDLYFVNEKGELSTSSWANPPTTAGIAPSSVVSAKWMDTNELVINQVDATHGSAAKQWGVISVGPVGAQYPPGAQDEPTLSSYMGSLFQASSVIAASQLKYGKRMWPGKKVFLAKYGVPEEVQLAHFPFQLDMGQSGAEHPAADYWLTSDSENRKLITLRQDMLGMDYLLGDQVTDLEVTDDGATVDDSRCISKEIDFDNWTVTSEIMEVPPNS